MLTDRLYVSVVVMTDAFNVLQPSKTGARRLIAAVFGLPAAGKLNVALHSDGERKKTGAHVDGAHKLGSQRAVQSASASSARPVPPHVHSSIPRSTRVPPALQPLIPHFRRLLRNHRYCPYGSIFAAGQSYSMTRSQLDQLSFAELLALSCPQSAVIAFVRGVLVRVIPLAVYGSEHNQTALLDSVARFVRLRKGEAMIAREVMYGTNTNDIHWLSTPQQQRADRFHQRRRVELLSRLCMWLMTDVVVPLLRCSFYVTDTETGKNRLSYYPHVIWQRICRHMFSTLTSSSTSLSSSGAAQSPQFRCLSAAERAALVRNTDAVLGVGHLRPRPRKAAIRPIVNMARDGRITANGEQRQWKSVNASLRNAFDVLTFERTRHTGLLGSSVFSLSDVYERYSAFVSLLRRERVLGCAPLYVVCVDIAQCFDCIDREQLCRLLPTVLRDESYALQRYSAVHDKLGSVTSRYQRMVYPASSFPSFPSLVAPSIAQRSNRRVYTDLVNRSFVSSSSLLSVTQSHLRSNVVQYAGRLYVQERGIPQGSALSALLCCMYLGDWENKHVMPLLRKMEERKRSKGKRRSDGHRSRVIKCCNLLMRHMDDVLFVTTDWKVAERFLPSVTASLTPLGLSLNEHKTKANFDFAAHSTAHQWAKSTTAAPLTRCEWMAWNGLLIHPVTLELKLDYSRLLLSAPSLSKGASSGRSCLAAHLTVQSCSHPGVAFARSICRFISARAHPLLLDVRLQSTTRVASNWYGMYVVGGMRLLCYGRELRRCRHGFVNERMIHAAMVRSIEFGWSLVRSRLSRQVRDSGGSGEVMDDSGVVNGSGGVLCVGCMSSDCYFHSLFPLSSCHVRWLAWCAYVQSVERKHSRFPELTRLARDELNRAEKHLRGLSPGVGCACCQQWRVLTRLRPLLWSEYQPLIQQCNY